MHAQPPPFKWTSKRRQAVPLLARGDVAEDVAVALDIDQATLWRWRQHPEFAGAVEAETERIAAAIRAEGVANKQFQVDELNSRHRLMNQVIAARAEANRRRALTVERDAEEERDDDEIDFEGYAAAGAETGLLVHTVTYLKDGRREEWAVDTGLLRELREHEKQAAQLLGFWGEEEPDGHRGGAGSAITIQIAAIDYRTAIAALAPGSMGNSPASGQDEGFGDGSTLG